MTTLYRSPNIVIDGFEWHLAVELRNGRPRRFTRWRPLGKPAMWQPITKWIGHMPKWRYELRPLERFKAHAKMAERGYSERVAA